MIETAGRVYGVPAPVARTIAWFPAVSSLILGVMLAVPATHARAAGMLKEDRLVENLTFIAYFVATGLGAAWAVRLARRRARPRVVAGAVFAALVTFVLGMEEISWAERLLHFRIPDLILHWNVQHESNVHNLEPFHDLSSWFPLILGVVAIAFIHFHTRPHRDATGLPSLLLPFCWVIIPLSGYDNLTDSVPINLWFDTIVGTLGEHLEMLVAIGFALGLGLAMRREVRAGPDPPRPVSAPVA